MQGDRHPRLGAIAVVLHEGKVLLARRKKEPDAGLWGFPGGHVEWGETAMDAAVRELLEETGVRAEAVEYLSNADVIIRKGDAVVTQFLLAGVLCRFVEGTPQAADDVSDAAWIDVSDVLERRLEMSDRVDDMVRLAQTRLKRLGAAIA